MLGLAALGCAALGSLAPSTAAPATKLALKSENIIKWNGAAYVPIPVPRQPNFVAATGKTFDYRIVITAQSAGGVIDTSYTGTVTAAVTTGTCTLGGTVSRACVAGVADFSDLSPATGTGPMALTFTSGGLTAYVTPVFTVVTPQYNPFALAQRGVLVEKPRLQVDVSTPTITTEYTLNPGLPVSATNVQTFQAAIDKFVSDNFSTTTRFKVTNGDYAEHISLKYKAATTGFCIFEPAGGVPRVAGQRCHPLDFLGGKVRLSVEWDAGVIACEGAAHHYRFNGIEIQGQTAASTTLLYWVVALVNRNFELIGAETINDYPSYLILDRCWVHGGDNVDVRHLIQPEGRHIAVINCYTDDAHNRLGGPNGSGDEQCISTVGAPGPILIDNNRLRGSGENLLFGGADPPFYDTRNRDFTVTHNFIEAPLVWQGVYRHKNNTEIKCMERGWFWGNIHDGAWDNNQNGTGLNVASNSSGTVDVNFEGVLDLAIEFSFFRTMTAWMLISAANTPNTTSTRRLSVHDNVGVNLNAPSTRYNPIPSNSINQVMAIGSSPTDRLAGIVVEHNTMLANPTNQTRTMSISGTPAGTSPTTYFDNNISTCSDYGVVGDGLTPGTASTSVGLPDDPFAKNVLVAPPGSYAHPSSGVPFPAASYYPASNAVVGFTDLAWLATADTADPDVICAGLVLAPWSPYKNAGTDGRDPGANIAAVRAAIVGVWSGVPAVTGAGWVHQRRHRRGGRRA